MINQLCRTIVLTDINAERERQIELRGIQRKTDNEWMPVLIEEVGEIAQAMQQEKPTDASNKYVEIIQAAAVPAQWAEQLVEEGIKKNAK